MSELKEQFNNGQQANFKRDTSKLLLWGNRFESAYITNAGGEDVTLPAGLVMGRITANGRVTPLEAEATDGSQFPVGILAANYTVAAGADQSVSLCVSGDVNEGMLSFLGSDTLDSVVDGRILRDRLAADTLGIKLVVSDELTEFDNE